MRRHPLGSFQRLVFFRPKRTERFCSRYKAELLANKQHVTQFWMTPLQYRRYWNDINDPLSGSAGCVTQYLKWKKVKHI